MYREDVFDWDWFLRNMTTCAQNNTIEWEAITPLIKRCDDILGEIVCRKILFFCERPQNYVSATLATTAFRIGISGFHLASAGYPDVSPILHRVLWEINIRLLHMVDNPVELSLAYMLNSRSTEIDHLSKEIQNRIDRNIALENCDRKLELYKAKYDEMALHAKSLGYDPEKIRKEYKNLKIRDICRQIDRGLEAQGSWKGPLFEKSYDVDYAFDCGYSHGNDNASMTFLDPSKNELNFNFGPINSSECLPAAADILNRIIWVLLITSQILEDEILNQKCADLMDEFEKTTEEIFPRAK
jgi:hypothetical protein